ncbi:TlpA family protein disulfide reductase [Rubrivirga sp. IMCC45206]|uniref:TlpA family protein disulfide reductase n=1 Tax=Rubrivirga sp. IMCC45206 TaxID=3391614 RepID=UPI0039900794
MRRLLPLALVLALAAPASAQSADIDTTFLNRNLRQQVALVDFLRARADDPLPTSDAEVDALIGSAATVWAAEAAGEDPLVGQLNPYVSLWLLKTVYSLAEAPLPEATECRAYTEFVVPAFLADLERVREVDVAHAPLIFWGHNYVGGPLAFRCDLDAEQWAALGPALRSAPALYQSYLDAGAVPNDDVESKVTRARQFLADNAPLYAIREDVAQGALDAAFAGLAAATTRAVEPDYLVPLAEAVWRTYDEAGADDYALATLDLAARSFSAVDLAPDTLAAWYAQASPEQGPDRFVRMTGTDLAPLVPSDAAAPLAGTYTDLQTGQPVDLAGLRGRTVVVDLWATWCGPCIAEIPHLQALVADYGDRIAFVSINVDAVTGGQDVDGVRAFMVDHGVDYPVLHDDPDRPLASAFGVGGYPAKFLVGADGTFFVHPSTGRRTVALKEIRAALDAAP